MSDETEERLPDHVLRAIERASEDDRIWFEAHQTRRWRLRNARLFELIDNDGSDQPPEGWTQRVVVILLAPGIRQRWTCMVSLFTAPVVSSMMWRRARSTNGDLESSLCSGWRGSHGAR